MATKIKIKSTTDPVVVKGSHLTVTTFPDGRTKLEWDDEQLLKEVREAIAGVKRMKPSVKAKSIKKVPEAMKRKPAVESTSEAKTKKTSSKKKAK